MDTLKRVAVVLLAGGFVGGLAGALAGPSVNAFLVSGVGVNPCSDSVRQALDRYQQMLLWSSLAGGLLASVLQLWLGVRQRRAAASAAAAAPASPPASGA
jgi:ABC-type xylose transport system permease subunit